MCAAHCPIVSGIEREGGHTPDLTTRLYLRIAACVSVCLAAIYTKREDCVDCLIIIGVGFFLFVFFVILLTYKTDLLRGKS